MWEQSNLTCNFSPALLVMIEFPNTVRVWAALPAPGRSVQQLSPGKHQKHKLSIATRIWRKCEGFLIN